MNIYEYIWKKYILIKDINTSLFINYIFISWKKKIPKMIEYVLEVIPH